MSTNTPINGLRVAALTDPANIETAVGQLATDVDSRLFSRFATPAARDLAIPSPVSGEVCYVASFNLPMMYYTSYWGFFPGTPVARLFQSVAQSIPGSATYSGLRFDLEEFDVLGGHSISVNTSRYTPGVPGRYKYHGSVTFDVWNVGYRACTVVLNGVTAVVGGQGFVPATPTAVHLTSTGSVTLNGTTDYIELVAWNDSGTAVSTFVGASVDYSTFQIDYAGSA